ncbi:MAG: alkaline phosphatase family protein [Gammaproteobacteria bacterium]
MTAPARVLFLEVDAGDRELVQQWARDGILPTFRRLLAEGLVGNSESVDALFVGATWPSLYTGVNPARHGIHSLIQLRPGTYEFYRCYTGENLRREPFWDLLSRAGRRVAVLDVPLSGISPGLNGIQSVEWGSHDANYGFRASPPEFAADLLARFGPYPLEGSCNGGGREPADFIVFRDTLLQAVRTKAEITRHYLRQGGWDFFCQVFTESHCVGHQCWHLHDVAHPAHDPAVTAITGDPMRAIYVGIDTAIGEILAEVGPETTVVVLLGHRMAHKFGAQFLLPEILDRLGVAQRRQPAENAATRLDAVLTRLWQTLPSALQDGLTAPRRLARRWLDARVPDVAPLPPSVRTLDAEHSQVFLMDSGFPASGLRLNLAGREPRGLIRPGDAEAFCARLTAELLAVVHDDTGEPAIRRVRRTRDLFQGDYLDLLPDLLVEWDDRRHLGSATCGNPRGSHVRVRSPRIGVVEGTNTYVRTGDHRREGLFMALGPGIRPGKLARTVSIMDFAPTFCALLDTPMPDVDGRVIAELVAGHTPSAT